MRLLGNINAQPNSVILGHRPEDPFRQRFNKTRHSCACHRNLFPKAIVYKDCPHEALLCLNRQPFLTRTQRYGFL
jgi:hypothetical protein